MNSNYLLALMATLFLIGWSPSKKTAPSPTSSAINKHIADAPNAVTITSCPGNFTATLPSGASTMPVSWATPTASTDCGTSCTPSPISGFTAIGSHNGSIYYISSGTSTWANAKTASVAAGGHLAVINNAAENEYLRSFLAPLSESAFIGISDETTEGSPAWVNGDPLSYQNSDGSNSSSNDYGLLNFWGTGPWSYISSGIWKRYLLEVECPSGSSIIINRNDSHPANGGSFAAGTYAISYTLSDNCSASATCNFTLTVAAASSGLQITSCPGNITQTAASGASGANVSWAEPTATTNCTTGGGCTPTSITGFTSIGEHNGSLYYISNTTANWQTGKTACENENGHLAVINNAAENDFIRAYLAGSSTQAFIGFHDSQTEGTYQWVNGDPVTYNNLTGSNSSSNDYGQINFWSSGPWDLRASDVTKKYILEVECSGGSSAPNIQRTDGGAANGGFFTVGTHNISYTVTDNCSNTANCNFSITVNSNSSCSNVTSAGTIGANESDCDPYNPANIFNGGSASGGTGTLEYGWEKSTTSASSGWSTISGATGSSYNPSSINQTTWYRRKARRSNCSSYLYSNVVSKEVGGTGCGGSCTDPIAGYSLIGQLGGSVYYLSDLEKNWDAAKLDCEAQGGHLAVITSAAENTLIKDHIAPLSISALIGLSDRTTEGNIQWVNGEALSYNNWSPNPPANSADDDATVINFWSSGPWNLVNYQTAKRFVLEKDCNGGPGGGCSTSNVTTPDLSTGQRGIILNPSQPYYPACTECNETSSYIIGTNRNHVEDHWDVAERATITSQYGGISPDFGQQKKIYRIGGTYSDGFRNEQWNNIGWHFEDHWNMTGGYPYDDFRYYLNEAKDLNADMTVTVNYGSGSAAEAGRLASYLNKASDAVRNQHGDPVWNAKYFEICNECSWDAMKGHANANDVAGNPTNYATGARAFAQQIRANSDIPVKIGVIGGTNSNWSGHDWGSYDDIIPELINGMGSDLDYIIFHSYPSWPLSATGQQSYSYSGVGGTFTPTDEQVSKIVMAQNSWNTNKINTDVRPLIESSVAAYNAANPNDQITHRIGIANTEYFTHLSSSSSPALVHGTLEALYTADNMITALQLDYEMAVNFAIWHQSFSQNVDFSSNLLFERNNPANKKPPFYIHELFATNTGDELIASESAQIGTVSADIMFDSKNITDPSNVTQEVYSKLGYVATKKADGTVYLAVVNRSTDAVTIPIDPNMELDAAVMKRRTGSSFEDKTMDYSETNLTNLSNVTFPGTSVSIIEMTPCSGSSNRMASETIAASSVQVVPNPIADDLLQLVIESEKTDAVTVEVYNNLGQLVSSKETDLATGKTWVSLDMQSKNLTRGVYFVKVYSKDKSYGTVRFLK